MNLKRVQHPGCDRWSHLWSCEVCRASASSSDGHRTGREACRLTRTVTALGNTFATVQKVHLPKLSDALSEVNAKTDMLVRQNEEILRRLDEGKRCKGKHLYLDNCRKRHVDLSFVSRFMEPRSERSADTARRHRAQRKTDLIHKAIVLLNVRLHLRSRRDSRRKGKC